MAAGDVNGDGRVDLVVANLDDDSVSVLIGTGTGTFQLPISLATVPSRPSSVAVGDFDGDGHKDIAVVTSFHLSVFPGTGSGGFGDRIDFPAEDHTLIEPSLLTVDDFNGDGRSDIALVNPGSNDVAIRLGTPFGILGPVTNFPVGEGPTAVAVGDFNGDGRRDLAVGNARSGTVSILLGTGSGTFGPATSFGPLGFGPIMAVGDFNGDGLSDVVAGLFQGQLSILLDAGCAGPVIPAPTLDPWLLTVLIVVLAALGAMVMKREAFP